jgi:hypothetical protein
MDEAVRMKRHMWNRRDFLKAAGVAGMATLSGGAVASIPIANAGLGSGVIDMRLDVGPGPFSRKADDIGLARKARDGGMSGFVISNSDFPTADRAAPVSQVVPEIAVFGGITLGPAIGGLNACAVERMARLSPEKGKVVWLPGEGANHRNPARSISPSACVVDSSGQVVRELLDIIDLIAKNDMVLVVDHGSSRELAAIAEAAELCGVRKLLVTYDSDSPLDSTLDGMKRFVERGVFVECPCPAVPSEPVRSRQADDRARTAVRNCVQAVKGLGADHCVLTSGLAAYSGADPVKHLSDFALSLREAGLEPDEIDWMTSRNPRRLLGLDGDGIPPFRGFS